MCLPFSIVVIGSIALALFAQRASGTPRITSRADLLDPEDDAHWCPNPKMRWRKEEITFQTSFFKKDPNDVPNPTRANIKPADPECRNSFGFTFEYAKNPLVCVVKN
jgi:hypothetical protein